MLTVLCSFIFFYGLTAAANKQILDEVEHDIMNHKKVKSEWSAEAECWGI